jgi:hypothetical protein
VLLLAAGLVAIDLTLMIIAAASGELDNGHSPVLDNWDLAKAVAVGAILIASGWRVRSIGLASFGVAFALVGIADEANAHIKIARNLSGVNPFEGVFGLHPTITQGIWEFVILISVAAVAVGLLLLIPGGVSWYPGAKLRLVALLAALLVFAGLVDAVDHLTGIQGVWSLVEESGERLVLSLALAYVVQVWWRIIQPGVGAEATVIKGSS